MDCKVGKFPGFIRRACGLSAGKLIHNRGGGLLLKLSNSVPLEAMLGLIEDVVFVVFVSDFDEFFVLEIEAYGGACPFCRGDVF